MPQQQSAVAPPWQIWGATKFSSPALQRGDELADRGQLNDAAEAYREAEEQTMSMGVQNEARLRRAGTLLKLGRSREVLELLSSYAKSRGAAESIIDERLAIIAAFAYEHQQNLDQTLAWLSFAYGKARKPAGLSSLLRRETLRILRGISAETFALETLKWQADPFVGTLLGEEAARRAQGGGIIVSSNRNWYDPASYRVTDLQVGSVAEHDMTAQLSENVDVSNEIVIGELLPLSGKYSQPALQVREGIELAAKEARESGKPLRLVVVDSVGRPEQAAAEYDKLSRRERAVMVLGPLDVESTLSVAKQAGADGAPFLSFAKREGLAGLSPQMFRLGVTAKDQVLSLLRYATKDLMLASFVVLYPANEVGRELAMAFRSEVARHGAVVVGEASYLAKNSSSIEGALDSVKNLQAQGVFIADSLSDAEELLDELEDSPLSNATLLGPAMWNEAEALRSNARALEGAIFVTPFLSPYLLEQSQNAQLRHFFASYKESFAKEPTLLAAQGYDAAAIVFSVLGSDSHSASTLSERLREISSFDGLTGELAVGSDGDIRRTLNVIQIRDGKPLIVQSANKPSGQLQPQEMGEGLSEKGF